MSRAIRTKDNDELYLDSNQYLQVKRRYNYYGAFTVMNLALLTHANKSTIGASVTLNVLINIVSHQNEAQATHEAIARLSNRSLPTVARHMRQLRESGLIINNEKVPYASYMIHPLYLWKGTAKQRDAYWDSLPPTHPFKILLKDLQTDYDDDDDDDKDEDDD